MGAAEVVRGRREHESGRVLGVVRLLQCHLDSRCVDQLEPQVGVELHFRRNWLRVERRLPDQELVACC